MREGNENFASLSRFVQLPGELLPGKTLVEIFGTARVLIEHHRGLLCYSSSEIIVRAMNGYLKIFGTDMQISCMRTYQLVICGHIDGVSLKKDGA